MKNPMISIVIPVFNEAGNIVALYGALKSVIKDMEHTCEVIFVDDGSTDDTYSILEQLYLQDANVRVVRFRRNFGQTAAIAAGLDHAEGDIIVTLDGDLQNDPVDIPVLIDKIKEGYDLASGWRLIRRDSFGRCLLSKLANWLISLATGVHLHDYGCTLKAMRREIAKELKLYGEMHRFIPALAASLGATIVEVPVRHHARRYGQSKYGIGRATRVILDLMTVKFLCGYATRPGHFFGLAGVIAFLLGAGITGVLGLERLLGVTQLADRPLLLLGILLMIIGIQSITMGLLSEMVSRIYHQSQREPVYRIKEVLNGEPRGSMADEFPPTERPATSQVIP
jgi:glycosyltransferase involved in cell wall biosynthesis